MRIISTIEEVKNYVSLTGTFTFARLSPHIDRVLRGYIQGLLGKELLDEVADAYETALRAVEAMPDHESKITLIATGQQYTLMADKYWELMKYLQDAVCNIAFMNCISQMQMTMSDSGIRLAVTENQKTAFQWQIDDLKYQLASDGYSAMNSLLLYLENTKEVFESWKNSDAYIDQKKYFVESAEQFNNAYYISNNRMTYLTLRYIMQRIELHDVKRMIGNEVFEKLKNAQKVGYNTKEQILMENFLIPGIVLLTVAKGIVERAIEVTDLGVQANLYTYYATLKDARKKSNHNPDREEMIAQLTNDANEFLKEGRKYIEANSSDFGVIEDTTNTTSFRVINKPNRGFYGM